MANQKTLDDLAKQVIDSQAGLMSVEDLKVFFEDVPPAQAPINQTPVGPVSAPAPQASTEPPAPIAEPVVSQPNILESMPEKFKDADAKTSVDKLVKSYAELEAELIKERGEKERLDNIVQTISNQTIPSVEDTVQPQIGLPDQDDVEESLFFEKPKEATTKVASKVAAAMLIAYHNALTEAQKRVQYVEQFKATHPNFNTYRDDMAMILKARPDLDKRVEALPMVYEMAKARYIARLDKMRKELGIQPEPIPVPPVPIPAPTAMTEAELIEKAKVAILAELQRRKAATGITGGVTPINPVDRAQQIVTQQPKTQEDAIFDEMMGSGPKKLELNL